MKKGTARTGGYEPQVDDLVWDETARQAGRVMGHVGPRWQLRPAAGGREWDADASALRPATPAEQMSFGVARANRRSTGQSL